jgi:hypothetical protein
MQTRAERMMSKIAGDGRLQHRSFLTRRDRGPGQEVLRLYDGVENSKPIELRVMMTDGTFRDAATLYEFIQQFWVEQAARFDLFPDADLFCTSVMLPLHNSQLSVPPQYTIPSFRSWGDSGVAVSARFPPTILPHQLIL